VALIRRRKFCTCKFDRVDYDNQRKVKDLNPIIAVIDILIDVIVLNHVATCATTSAATITSTINYHHHHLKQYVLIIADGGQLEVSFGFILFPVERLWRERKLSSGSEISNSWYSSIGRKSHRMASCFLKTL